MLHSILETLHGGGRFLITTHVHPDGDGLGAGLALWHVLRGIGKSATFYAHPAVPYNFRFLPGAADVVTSLPRDASFDATIVVDCAEAERCGPDLPNPDRRGRVLVIDHHLDSGRPFADVLHRDESAAAVGEMVYFIIRALGRPVTADVARCIYCSILSDTGSFRYSNTSPAAMRIAAEMIGVGVSPWEMASHLYETVPMERLVLLQRVLGTLETAAGGRAAAIVISGDMLADTGCTADMVDGFINYARSIDGVEVAVQFREMDGETEQGGYQVSFRSRGRVNVADVARVYGGGGHHNAAGCTLQGDLADVKARIYDAIARVLD